MSLKAVGQWPIQLYGNVSSRHWSRQCWSGNEYFGFLETLQECGTGRLEGKGLCMNERHWVLLKGHLRKIKNAMQWLYYRHHYLQCSQLQVATRGDPIQTRRGSYHLYSRGYKWMKREWYEIVIRYGVDDWALIPGRVSFYLRHITVGQAVIFI
jgi:hypothetical protein